MEANIFKNEFLNAQKRWADQKLLLLALAISIVLNIGVMLIIQRTLKLTPAAVRVRPIEIKNDDRSSWVFTLAETPESARREKPPEKAAHISDKNAVAQNPTAPPDLPIGVPFANGSWREADAVPSPELQTGNKENSKLQTASEDLVSSRFEAARSTDGISSNFRREFLTGEANNHPAWPFASRYEPGRQNLDSRAPELGSFSLNTYAWEYAPYLLWLKDRVQRHIYPPPAFTHMGMISGHTTLRFRINRDGSLQNLELIGYEGHKALMETSVRAIQTSAPFRALPKDFPEAYLEVTAQFDYVVKR
jgi:outer membrane biosynthesis protein TonB